MNKMNEVSLSRLYVLRALYLLVVIGLGINIWPTIIRHATPWGFFHGVELCMMASFSLLCAVGIRYPLQMLPVLMWELIWKTIWLAIVALPLWLSGHLGEEMLQNVFAISLVVLVYLAMPWPYVYSHYVKKHGDKWRKA
jgi:hypothetical protein